MSSLKEKLAVLYPEMMLCDGMDEAFIGTALKPGSVEVACYSVEKIIKILKKRDGMTEEDAWEFYSYNIGDAYVGEHTPIFVEPLTVEA